MTMISTPAIDLRVTEHSADSVRVSLGLVLHPEGGHYRELWRDQPTSGARGAASGILFLLAAGERSRWHRVDAAEIWLWHAGAPLQLTYCSNDMATSSRLGPNLAAQELLQAVVPAHAWQEAMSLGAWTLVSCVVAPAFEFSGFEMAAPGWAPTRE